MLTKEEKRLQKREYLKRWRAENPEKRKAQSKRYRKNNQEYIKQYQKDNQERIQKNKKLWYEKNPNYSKNYHEMHPENKENKKRQKLKREYGITLEQYNEMIIKQNGKCAICNDLFHDNSIPHVDHCHKTNKVRGLLCKYCNWLLGHAKDDIAILHNAIHYIEDSIND